MHPDTASLENVENVSAYTPASDLEDGAGLGRFASAEEAVAHFESQFASLSAEAFSPVLAEAEAAYAEPEAEDETPADLRQRIVAAALAEVTVWGNGLRHEGEAEMRPTLKGYWQTLLDPAKAETFIDKQYAWSAAFVSTCMKRAGAGAAFEQDPYHAGYVANAKVARERSDQSKYWAFSVTEAKPELGDVVVKDRPPTTNGPCGGLTFENVKSRRTGTSHGDIVVAVRADAIDVVGGNVAGSHRPTKSDTVARRTIQLDGNGYVVQPAGCKFFAIVKPPGGSASGGILDVVAGLPTRIAELVRAGIITVRAGAAIAAGERDEGKLTNLVFYAKHPELPDGYKIQKHEQHLVQDWTRIRDEVVRPLLRTLGAAPRTPTPSGVSAATVSRIDAHRTAIEQAANANGVAANVLRGIIAAESGGNERTGEGGSGYKGLMQAERDVSHLTPSVSLNAGAKKYLDFTQSMRRFFRETLQQDFDALAEETRIRIVMAGYNAGPLTVKRAMTFARTAGDVTRWVDAEHYLRALVSTGAYNPVPSVIEWCVTRGELSANDAAADLARLSGKSIAEIQRLYQTSGAWNVKKIAAALKVYLFREKDQMKNDGSVTFAQAQSRASKSLLCASRFKQSHTTGYLDTVVRYKRFYDTRS